MKTLLALCAVVIGFAAFGTASAQAEENGHHRHHSRHHHRHHHHHHDNR